MLDQCIWWWPTLLDAVFWNVQNVTKYVFTKNSFLFHSIRHCLREQPFATIILHCRQALWQLKMVAL